jgi:hypothetical protein
VAVDNPKNGSDEGRRAVYRLALLIKGMPLPQANLLDCFYLARDVGGLPTRRRSPLRAFTSSPLIKEVPPDRSVLGSATRKAVAACPRTSARPRGSIGLLRIEETRAR